jgi:hypothetical protein
MGMPVARSLVQTVIRSRSSRRWRRRPPGCGRRLVDDRAGAFVVAQGVHADPGAAGGLGDTQARLGVAASRPGYRLRLDFERPLNPNVEA